MASSGKGQSGSSRALTLFSKELREQSRPLRQQAFKQGVEAFSTGGVGARVPSVQRSLEASRQASAQATRGAETAISAVPGLRNSPTLLNILANARTSDVTSSLGPSQAALGIAGQAPGIITRSTAVAQGGLTSLAANEARSGIAQQQAFSQLLSGLFSTGARAGEVIGPSIIKAFSSSPTLPSTVFT